MSERMERFKKYGLLGCFDGTGVNSENYKDILYGDGWISVKERLPEDCHGSNRFLVMLACDHEMHKAIAWNWAYPPDKMTDLSEWEDICT